MREIKFRIYHKKYKCIAKVDDINFGGDQLFFGIPVEYKEDPDYTGLYEASFDEVEFMQLTGLKDANDKEIWEGDIISVDVLVTTEQDEIIGKPLKEDYVLGVVEFNKGSFVAVMTGDNGEKAACDIEEDCIVLGNIYEHPELLK